MGSLARRVVAVTVVLAGVFGLAILFGWLRVGEAGSAPWWPAAGFSTIAVLLARKRAPLVVLLLVLVTGLANFAAGTSLLVSLCFGVLNAAEAGVIAWIVSAGNRSSSSFGLSDATRFALAALLGSVIAGLAAGATVATVEGAAFLPTAATVMASHLSANLLIVPFAILPHELFVTRHVLELAAQVAITAVLVAVVFAPGQHEPVASAIFPLIAWLVLRFPTGIVIAEIAAIAFTTFILTLLGGGPFVETQTESWIALTQVFTIALALTALLSSATSNDRTRLLLRARAREELLRGGVVNSHAGFLIVEEEEERGLIVAEANPTGVDLLREFLTEGPTTRSLSVGTLLEVNVGHALAGMTGGKTQLTTRHGRIVDIEITGMTAASRPAAVVVVLDVTQHIEDQLALERTLENERLSAARLAELNRQKDVFLEAVSHELRTPVSSILGYAQLLEDENLPAASRSHIDVISRNAERLTSLISDLVAASKAPAGLPPVRLSAIDVTKSVECSLDLLTPAAAGRGIRLEHLCADAPIRIESDSADLERIVSNLLSNAIKFANPGTAVQIEYGATDETVTISIRDTGTPLSAVEIGHVFDRFYRAPHAVTNAIPGTGLGLTIAQVLAHRLDGEVALTSTEAGVVTATLTLRRVAAPRMQLTGSNTPAAGGPGLS